MAVVRAFGCRWQPDAPRPICFIDVVDSAVPVWHNSVVGADVAWQGLDRGLASSLGVTRREDEVLGAVVARLSNAEIAAKLFISERTVESHVSSLLRKLVARDRVQLVERVRVLTGEGAEHELGIGAARNSSGVAARVTLHGRPTLRPSLPLSTYRGRDDDTRRVLEQLGRCRIMTISGPGGVGKSRLARHVAHDVADGYDDGVLWVELGPLNAASDVPNAVAAALRLTARSQESVAGRVAEVLAVRHQLMVLDNCEHVAEGVAALVEYVSSAAPHVDVMLTSRERLRIDGEHVIALDPLAIQAAVELFVDRAAALSSATIAVGDPVIADIVSRLDCLPLAIELAAAQVPAFGISGLRDALRQPFDILNDGARASSPRQGSLFNVVKWSYELLNQRQREVFVSLAVFADGVEADAAIAVCQSDGPVLRALAELADRSMITVRVGEPTIYGMLQTLREFARREQTHQLEGDLRRHHTAWALQLAEATMVDECSSGQPAARRRFDVHLAELRQAHAHLMATASWEQALRLTIVLAHHAYHRLRVDLAQHVEHTLDVVPSDAAPLLRARVLGIAANYGWQRGDFSVARARGEAAISIATQMNEPICAREAHGAMGTTAMLCGDMATAQHELMTAYELAAAANDAYTLAVALLDLGLAAAYGGDEAAAIDYERRLHRHATDTGAPSLRAWAHYLSGERRAETEPDAAIQHLSMTVKIADSVDDRFLSGVARHTLLTTAARRDGAGADLSSFGVLIDHWHTFGRWTQLWLALRALIDGLSRQGQHRDVALLLGANASSTTAPPAFAADAARLVLAAEAASAALGDSYDALTAEGSAGGDDLALALARRLTRSATVG